MVHNAIRPKLFQTKAPMKTIGPKATGLSKVAISKLAESVATDLGYLRHKNIRKTIDEIGGDVEVVDYWLQSNQAGSLKVQGESDFRIYVPAHTTIERDNFTIAHELGHYVLHYLYFDLHQKKGQIFEATRYGSGREEWEANWFAASFLMPDRIFKAAFKSTAGHIDSLARKFKVSTAAAWVRAQSLELNGQS